MTTERSFQKRWVSLSSIESALRLRYPFGDHYNFDKGVLSKSLRKLYPKIDSLQEKNGLGVYRCKMSGVYFFTIQDPMLAPPEMPTTYSNNSKWNKLCKVDEKLLPIYEKKSIKLFNPTLGKSVKQCLCDRDKLLQNIIEDADKVETIIED